MGPKRYRWWHGVAFYAGIQVASFALKTAARALADPRKQDSPEADRQFYRSERLPAFAPPGAAFPIAWSINSISSIAGGLHVLNLPAGTEGRAEFLRLQGAAWALFSTFNAAYFGLRSPLNAAAVTLVYSAVTAASLDIAWRRMRDPVAALSLATTALWLMVANPLAIAQASWNHDSFWNAGPFAEPKPEWLKGP